MGVVMLGMLGLRKEWHREMESINCKLCLKGSSSNTYIILKAT